MIPFWLHCLSIVSLLMGLVVAVFIAADEGRRPQHMWIMDAVWPITMLYSSVIGLWGYLRYGRAERACASEAGAARHMHMTDGKPFAASVGVSATHCGAGCTLGDIIAEWLCFAAPGVAVWFGWHSIFAERMFAVWIVDFVFAFVLGIGFQYFTIAPMRGLSLWPGLVAALQADTLTLTAWQTGMYGFMALAQYFYFRPLLGTMPAVDTPEFWFTMQLAMLCGFVTSYPVNWWLIRAGIKERM